MPTRIDHVAALVPKNKLFETGLTSYIAIYTTRKQDILRNAFICEETRASPWQTQIWKGVESTRRKVCLDKINSKVLC